MQVQSIDRMFNFTFEKSAEEILAAVATKSASIQSKIAERGLRITKMREENKVTDAVLIDIQNQMRANERIGTLSNSYTSNARTRSDEGDEEVTVGAGVITFLQTEQDFIEGEKAQLEKLNLMTRNLRPINAVTSTGATYNVPFKLSYEELKYLGL